MNENSNDDLVTREALQALVDKRTAELRQSNLELQRSNEELQQFVYVASHDLQEPLRVLTNFSELLQQRYSDQLDEDGREFLGYMSDAARRMRKLIRDLLEYSRVQTRGSPSKRVNMNLVAARALGNLRMAVREADVQVQIDELPQVQGDANQLERLLQNLIGNGIKYRRADQPRVRVSAKTEDGEVRFLVEDNGIGIAEDSWGRIFLIFQRLHTPEEYEGTGIGLAICKRIV